MRGESDCAEDEEEGLGPEVDWEEALLEGGECGAGEGAEGDFGVDEGLKEGGAEEGGGVYGHGGG